MPRLVTPIQRLGKEVYAINRLSFGTKPGSAHFQLTIEMYFFGCKCALFVSHLEHLQVFLQALKDVGLKL